ncbi:hypothetical protein Ddye_019905 [Dipteronia dyeriana]|uniref:RNase H type-1 domain-containing protein n=1 Tax=Dipteronia dyeriana TaxID=168575 RepID=A0AAD9TZR9_9ROSI|nr:hypothetical protein Ddye_019905 [Dipteronia dyeriana]
MDGSSRGNPGDIGIVGVRRDYRGKNFCLFSFFMGWLDAITVEVLTIHRACQLIVNNQLLYVQSIDILSDSSSAVSYCNNEEIENLSLANFVYDIRQLQQSRGRLSIKFLSRGSIFLWIVLPKIVPVVKGISQSGVTS